MALNLKELFDKHQNEHLRFERVENKRSRRPDINAFILLDEILPDEGVDMVTAAEPDEIWLAPEIDDLAAAATEEQIIDLIRCGVRLDNRTGCLAMFV